MKGAGGTNCGGGGLLVDGRAATFLSLADGARFSVKESSDSPACP